MKDAELAFRNLAWQEKLQDGLGLMPEIVLTYDTVMHPKVVENMERQARRVYSEVKWFVYPAPPPGWWPPNQAFQQTAYHMAKQDKSWLWLEPDCIPLCPEWLKTLSDKYHRAGKKFFAPKIPELGHYNGTGIYPFDTPKLIPHAMQDRGTAWDVSMRAQMTEHAYDAMPFIYHIWSQHGERFSHCSGGAIPNFTHRGLLRQIPPSAVLFHRDKNGSLITMLEQCLKESK